MKPYVRNIVYVVSGVAVCAFLVVGVVAGIRLAASSSSPNSLTSNNASSTSHPTPSPSPSNSGGPVIVQPPQGNQVSPPPGKSQGGGYSADFLATVRQSVANGLHMTVDDVTSQLSGGKYITDLATAQGLSADQLRALELSAYQAAFDQAVKNGNYTQAEADGYMAGYRNRSVSALNDNVTLLFGGAPRL